MNSTDTQKTTFTLKATTARRLKVYAASHGVAASALVDEAILRYLDSREEIEGKKLTPAAVSE